MSDRNTTSHFAANEECCRKMANKYGWTLIEARQRSMSRDPLAVETAPAIVSLDSFDGDLAAYEAWKSKQVVTA